MSNDSSFTLVINNTNVVNTNTNATYEYKFIGGGFNIPEGFMCMVSSAQIPYSIFNITTAYNNNRFRLSFPTGSLATSYTDFNITIPDGFILLMILIHICNNTQFQMVYI